MQQIRRHRLEEIAKRYESQRVLADAIDTTPGYINQLLNGYRSIGEKTARKIESKLGLPNLYLDNPETVMDIQITSPPQLIDSNAEWRGALDIWDSTTPLRDDEVALPFFREVEVAAGAGRTHQVIQNHGCQLRFAKSTLKRKGVLPENAYCVTVSGNSMTPVLPHGSTIGIDTGTTHITNGDIYAIDHAGELRVKMVYKLPGGGLRLKSFNSAEWPDEHYTEPNCADIKILGRMFWSSTLW